MGANPEDGRAAGEEAGRLSRRGFVTAMGAIAGATVLGAGALGADAAFAAPPTRLPQTPDEALRRLLRGNRRYRRGDLELRDYSPVGDRVAESQKPFAAIITCADSRISPTLVFDIGRGNLFVSRVAGNSVDTGTLGSTEYAVAVLGVKLVMILGHSDCGAVKAAIGVADGTATYPPDRFGAIGAFVDAIVPAVSAIPEGERSLDRAIDANAVAQAQELAASEPIIKPAVDNGSVRVVAAVYDVASGRVSLL
jgi:carbonic anhydrase